MRILLIAYDNASYTTVFPLNLGYIASALLAAGHEVEIYNQDLHHYPDEHLTKHLDENHFDVVGLGVVAGYYQFRKMKSIANAINTSTQRPFFVLGGHGPSPEPEYFIKVSGADAIVIGEGEETIVDLLDALTNNRPLKDVLGIAYSENGNVYETPRRSVIKDVDNIPFPAHHLFPINIYRLLREPNCKNTEFVMPILSGRGCTFHCTFCYRMDKGFRPRSPESIVDEIRFLNKEYHINYFGFFDELMMSSTERAFLISEAFLRSGIKFRWNCQGRLNYVTPELIRVMKKAGCVFINYGIESFDDLVMKNMKKALTTDIVIKGVEATLQEGVSPGLGMIFGNIGDTRETLEKGVDFLLKYCDLTHLRTIRPVTPYPGTELYDYAIKHNMLKDCADFYENKHLNSDLLTVNFTNLTDDEFHKALYEANTILIKNYYNKLCQEHLDVAKKLYFEQDYNFRGFRQT